ncbi:MAG: hypothetical protein ACYSU4_11030 [Planctomycetota bacterium]|jgi:hypothetical protein
MIEEKELYDFLKKQLRPKQILRIVFYALVLTVAVDRVRNDGFSYENLARISLKTLTVTAVISLFLVVILWHFAFYEPFILFIKDFITKKLNIINYRHWINKIANEMNCEYVNPEAIYGSLKWDKDSEFNYPHKIGSIVTPSLHTFYFIPVAWLLTIFWVPKWDLMITVGVIMIPLSFVADIAWERIETSCFIEQQDKVREKLKKYVPYDDKIKLIISYINNGAHSFQWFRDNTELKYTDNDFQKIIVTNPKLFKAIKIVKRDEEGKKLSSSSGLLGIKLTPEARKKLEGNN